MANIIELIIKAQDLASDKLSKVSKASNDMSDALAPVKRGMEVAALAIGAAGVASVKMAGDLQQSLNVFQSVSGATAQQMALVSEKARQLGKDAALPGVSAADAALAMTELAKAGLSVNETMAASKGVLSLAKAGNIEVGEAATVAAQALNAFSLKGDQAGRVADVLSAASNASASDVQGLALGLQQSAAVANQFGVSLEDTATTLALFSNRGMQGSDAGTSLKTMLIALANPSKQASEAMNDIGLKAYDASGKFVGMRQLAINLQDSLKGLTEEQKQQALATIFGTDAFRAASFLAGSAGKAYDDMSSAVGRSGAAADLAKAQNAGFKGALDNLISTAETAGTDIGTKLLPPITDFIKAISNSGVFDAVVNNIDSIGLALGVLATIFAAFKIGMFIQGIVNAANAMKAATGATTLFNAILLANPIVLIVTAVIALIAILVALQLKFNIFGKAFDWLKGVATVAFDGIKTALSAVGAFFTSVWQAIQSVVNVVFQAITAYVMLWFNVYAAIFNAILTVATAVWNFLYNGIIKPVIDFIVAYFNIVGAIWNYIMQWIIALATLAWNFIYANVIKPIIDLIIAYFNFWAGIFQGVMNFIVSIATAAWNWIYNSVIKPVFNGIVAAGQWMQGVIGGIWNWISSVASGVWNNVANFARGAWNGIVGVWNQVYGFFSGIAGHIGSAIGGAFNGLAGAASGAFNGVKSAVVGAINWVIDKINGAIDAVNSVADKIPGAPKLGHLGRLASGTPSFAGGLTMVGERGPEIAALPQGTRVMSATATRQALGDSGGGRTTYNIDKVELGTAEAVREFFNINANDNELAQRGLTPRRGY